MRHPLTILVILNKLIKPGTKSRHEKVMTTKNERKEVSIYLATKLKTWTLYDW